jgi:hypothetical protein
LTLASGARLGRYEILAPVGAGGMGEVYRARDASLDRDVAVKVLPERVAASPDALARFEREAKAIAALSHPNILAIHEFGRDDGTAYAVTELLEGETLRQRLAAGPIPSRKAVEYAIQVANGLAAAHAKGLVHRDLKPENLFLTRDGRVKILDFGLVAHQAREGDDVTSAPTLGAFTDPGAVVGTVGYMSPEQVRGARVDARTDIFALGAVLYEMLTGTRAFQRDTPAETMTAVLREDVPEVAASGRQVPAALDRLVRRCLEKSVEERLQSARDLAIALEALSGSDVSAALAPPRSRLPARGLALAAGLVVAGAALGFLAGDHAELLRARPAARELPRYSALTFRRGRVDAARFTSDGATVVYSAVWDSEPSRVFATPSDGRGGDAPPIVESSLLALSRSGELAVATAPSHEHLIVRGTLAQLPLGGGAPRELLEDVTAADWSADGRLAVVRSGAGHTRLEFPIGTVLYETAGWLSSPRFSPAGDTIAFHEHPLHGDDRGWPALVVVATRSKHDLTPELGSVSGLAWRPDGREVCFASGATILCSPTRGGQPWQVLRGPALFELHDIASDGRLLVSAYTIRSVLMASSGGPEVDLSWLRFSMPVDVAPSNKQVLFETLDYGIYLRGVDRGPPVRLGDGLPTGLSPDGRRVLAIVPGVPSKLALIPTGAGETTTFPSGSLAQHDWAVWMPDGRRIVVSGAEPGRGSRLYVQDVEGGLPRPITEEGVRLEPYVARAVSPDGRFVTALRPDGQAALYPVEGGEPRPIPGLGPDLVPLGWTDRPDVLFARPRRDGRTRPVYRVQVATGRRQLWKELGLDDRTGAPSVRFAAISPDGGSYAYAASRVDTDLFAVSGAFPEDRGARR